MKKRAALSAPLPSFASALGHEPADKRIDILRLVGESGSISQAARQAKVSYKAAWQAIDTLSNLAGVALVESAVGGSGGGGATLTPAGTKLLAMAGLLAEARSQVLAGVKPDELLPPRTLPALSRMNVRTSMRNQLPCEVDKLVLRGQVARVHLKLADGTALVSRITRASAELLGLQKGQTVLALCKATAVTIGAQGSTPEGVQSLKGRAVRISRGADGDEISLQLDGGLQLVGFAAPGSGLKTKDLVEAIIDESAVVIALAA
jgi:molybdate transport system regulatory protein